MLIAAAIGLARRVGSILLLTLVASATAAAAQPRPAPEVSGVVVDSTDAVLPFAQVQLATASGEAVQTTTTGPAGVFAFERVTPGRYQVLVTLDGFEPRTETVNVGRRPLKPLRIALALAGVHQEVTVTGGAAEVATGAAANADAVTVSAGALESLPIFDDDAVAAISKFLDSGSLGTGGVTILVNGMEVNSLNVSTSAIQQIKINEDPYSAAFSRPGRGRINILTKPGSREYHGDASVIARDSSLNARNAFASDKPPEQRRIVDAFLGGPLGGGATSFMASLKDDTEARQAIVFALGPDGDIRDAVSRPFRHLLVSVGVTRQHGGSTMSIRPRTRKRPMNRVASAARRSVLPARPTITRRSISPTTSRRSSGRRCSTSFSSSSATRTSRRRACRRCQASSSTARSRAAARRSTCTARSCTSSWPRTSR